MNVRTASLALLMIAVATPCAAQAPWKWRGADGLITYSDQPPPVSVPASSILSTRRSEQPAAGGEDPLPASAADAAPLASASTGLPAPAEALRTDSARRSAPADGADGADGAPPRASAPQTAADRLTALRKAQAEKEAAEKKAREKQQSDARVAQWCDDLRGRASLLESGRRLAGLDANGEQAILEDGQREAQLVQVRRDLESHCRKGS